MIHASRNISLQSEKDSYQPMIPTSGQLSSQQISLTRNQSTGQTIWTPAVEPAKPSRSKSCLSSGTPQSPLTYDHEKVPPCEGEQAIDIAIQLLASDERTCAVGLKLQKAIKNLILEHRQHQCLLSHYEKMRAEIAEFYQSPVPLPPNEKAQGFHALTLKECIEFIINNAEGHDPQNSTEWLANQMAEEKENDSDTVSTSRRRVTPSAEATEAQSKSTESQQQNDPEVSSPSPKNSPVKRKTSQPGQQPSPRTSLGASEKGENSDHSEVPHTLDVTSRYSVSRHNLPQA